FTGGYTIIKDYMRERDQRRQEVFVPLSHPPGRAQQCGSRAARKMRVWSLEADRQG
ncbi:hypothetical protein EV561_1531, partial [Rhizobium sp. BK376]